VEKMKSGFIRPIRGTNSAKGGIWLIAFTIPSELKEKYCVNWSGHRRVDLLSNRISAVDRWIIIRVRKCFENTPSHR
jgi:hypothetical protein